MGRAPSKSVVFFSEDNMFDDRDTCLDLCWKPAQLCVHAGEILAEWRIWQWGPNFQQQRVSYISMRYSFPFIGNTVCPGPPWLLELRGPYGSGCLSGSAMHEFKSLTRSLDVWIQIVIIRVAETVDFTFVQFKISTMICQLNTQYTQEVYKLHKHAGFWIQQTLSILTSSFLAVNTYTFFSFTLTNQTAKSYLIIMPVAQARSYEQRSPYVLLAIFQVSRYCIDNREMERNEVWKGADDCGEGKKRRRDTVQRHSRRARQRLWKYEAERREERGFYEGRYRV